jgi:ribosome-binding factor A
MTEVKDPRIGFATVQRVEVTDDLRHAKVNISIMGDEAERRSTMIGLQRSAAFLRTMLAHRLSLRTVPELHFAEDLNLDHAARISHILANLNDPVLPPLELEQPPESAPDSPASATDNPATGSTADDDNPYGDKGCLP